MSKLLELGADPFAVNNIGLTALLNAEGNWAGSAPPPLAGSALQKHVAAICADRKRNWALLAVVGVTNCHLLPGCKAWFQSKLVTEQAPGGTPGGLCTRILAA